MSQTEGAAAGHVLRSRSDTPPLLPYLASVIQRRHFIKALAVGELRSQHLDTVLGNLWHVLNPVLSIGVYYLVFGVLLATDRGIDNFVGFLAIGIFAFTFSQRTVISCSGSIAANLGLVRSLQFPRAVLPIATVIQEFLAYATGFGVMLVVLVLTGEFPRLSWLLAPVLVVALTMFSAGLGLIVARLGDSLRDVTQVIPYLFRILLYMSGIIFSIQGFILDDRFSNPELIRLLFVLDPYFTYINLLRDVLMTSYSAEFPLLEWTYVLITAPVTLVLGLAYFRGAEKEYGRG